MESMPYEGETKMKKFVEEGLRRARLQGKLQKVYVREKRGRKRGGGLHRKLEKHAQKKNKGESFQIKRGKKGSRGLTMWQK